jgi:hypothetical protein
MNNMKFLTLLCAFCISTLALGQEKYAILISGDSPDYSTSEEGLYWASWNDTYLMWEMLTQEKGYDPDNVFVLFAGGEDYSITNPDVADRYTPPEYVTVTDYSATLANVYMVFDGLANGTNGFTKATEDDFLFVWTFVHGGRSGGNSTLYLIDGIITDTDFAALVNPIAAQKIKQP